MKNTPFERAFKSYLAAGWTSPFPTPYMKKDPPPAGVTGYKGKPMSIEAMEAASGNICLHMPTDLIGIDVDNYEDKMGAHELEELVRRLGPLPAGYRSTNRMPTTDGFIAFFRVPAGIKWINQLGPSIEIIQSSHRYAAVWPSVHKSGRTYRWTTHEGRDLDFIPGPQDFPVLPAAWVDHMYRMPISQVAAARREAEISISTSSTIELVPEISGMCAYMRAILISRIEKIENRSSSRHDEMLKATEAIIAEASKGHRGARMAVATYGKKWMQAFKPEEAAGRNLKQEILTAVEGSKRRHPAPVAECACSSVRTAQGRPMRLPATSVSELAMARPRVTGSTYSRPVVPESKRVDHRTGEVLKRDRSFRKTSI